MSFRGGTAPLYSSKMVSIVLRIIPIETYDHELVYRLLR